MENCITERPSENNRNLYSKEEPRNPSTYSTALYANIFKDYTDLYTDDHRKQGY